MCDIRLVIVMSFFEGALSLRPQGKYSCGLKSFISNGLWCCVAILLRIGTEFELVPNHEPVALLETFSSQPK